MTVAIVYHPDITVRTAYDLKPLNRSKHGGWRIGCAITYIYNDLYNPHSGDVVVVVGCLVGIAYQVVDEGNATWR